MDPTDYVDTGGGISIYSAYEDVPVNNNNNNATLIGYLDSYFSALTVMISISANCFCNLLDALGSHISSVHVPSGSTLPLLVVYNTNGTLQFVRPILLHYCTMRLMVSVLKSQISFHQIFFTCFSLISSSTSSNFKKQHLSFPMDLPLSL